MRPKSIFLREGEGRVHPAIAIAVTLLTLGLSFIFLYDELHERHYMINRRRLLRAIRRGQVKVLHKRPLFANEDITEYALDVDGESVNVWVWYDMRLSAHTHDDKNAIGLFEASLFARILRKRLVRAVESLASNMGIEKNALKWE